MTLFFYELHEGGSDLTADAILVSDKAYMGEVFADLVKAAREAVLETFEEDTLVEAVAHELQRRHGFLHIDDAQLRAAVNVSANEADTFIAHVEESRGGSRDDADDDLDDEGYRTVVVPVERDARA